MDFAGLEVTSASGDSPASSGSSAADSAGATGTGASGAMGTGGATAASTGTSAGGTSAGGASSSGTGGTGGAPLECWGPGAVCCGGVACAIGTHECCFTDQTQAANGQCVPVGDCPESWVSVSCDDTEDCPGGACCTTWTGSQHVGMQCTTIEACTPPNLGAPGNYPMCNYPDGTCPPSMSCHQDCCVGSAGWGYCYY